MYFFCNGLVLKKKKIYIYIYIYSIGLFGLKMCLEMFLSLQLFGRI